MRQPPVSVVLSLCLSSPLGTNTRQGEIRGGHPIFNAVNSLDGPSFSSFHCYVDGGALRLTPDGALRLLR